MTSRQEAREREKSESREMHRKLANNDTSAILSGAFREIASATDELLITATTLRARKGFTKTENLLAKTIEELESAKLCLARTLAEHQGETHERGD